MNGRMYDPVIGRFLSTDPLIQLPEYNQSYNRYSYALNNPLKYTDPSGFAFVQNMDWFINEITGDVYYNSELKKGDENQLIGEGWKHFAENGKFSLKREHDYKVLADNIHLTEFRSVNRANGSAEAYFKGKNAETFMNKQGYEFQPTISYDKITHQYPVNRLLPGMGTISQENLYGVRVITSRTYVQKGLLMTPKSSEFYSNPSSPGTVTIYTKTEYIYSNDLVQNFFINIISKLLETKNMNIDGQNDDYIEIHYSWDKINDPVLLKFKNK